MWFKIGNKEFNIGFYWRGYYPFFAWNPTYKCIPLGICNVYIWNTPQDDPREPTSRANW